MKWVVLFFVVIAGCVAGPAVVSNNCETNAQDEAINRLSDLGMHPHKESSKHEAKSSMRPLNAEEETKEYWMNNAKAFVEQQVKQQPNTNKARNVIMFLGDGMSHYSVAGARMLMGGEQAKLYFENFPYTANSKTYCVDVQVADSACTATAYLSGVKTNDGEIGVNAEGMYGNCEDTLDESTYVDSIGAWFQEQGRSTGIVTTTRVTHASPAGVYAHTTNRDWEDDRLVALDGCSKDDVEDIAEQLIYGKTGSKLKVILGGGSRHFVNATASEHGTAGRRNDGKNLINEWLAFNPTGKFVRNREELLNVSANVDKLFGLFNGDHIQYYIDVVRDKMEAQIPTLEDMTKKAIEVLDTDTNGYFLFVEGGRIDHGHHRTQAKHALSEAVEFSKAIEAAAKMVNLNETLIVVTADHGHVMTLGGYADRGHDVFGVAGTADDDKPYMTLSYANGESYPFNVQANGERVDPTKLESYTSDANDHKFPATVPRLDETHGGEDVGIWAVGPWAHLFQGTLEQNLIAHIMAYASCVGEGLTACDK